MMPVTIRGLCPLLQVFDMPQSLAFYCDRLGFEIVQSDRDSDDCDWVWLRWGSAELMLNTAYEVNQRPAAPDPRRVAAHADTALYIGTPDVEALYSEWRDRYGDVAPPVIRDYGMKQWTITDPDGYLLCFQCPASAP
jgi:glyoxylase I family protein